MKSIQEFLLELSDLDIKLWSEGDKLRCNAPQEVLTNELKSKLADRKGEIITFLQQLNPNTNSQITEIQPIPRDGNLPLSSAQQGLWFLEQLEGGSAAYNQLFALHFQGDINKELLEKAFQEIVRRHEALRTSFSSDAGQPVQAIAPEVNFALTEVKLGATKQWEEIDDFAIAESQRPFDLAQAPLMRVTLLRLSEQEQVLLFTIHHIIADGWSGAIIIKELAVLYEAFSQGKSSPLPELPFHYADFAHWQQQQGETFASQLNYWKKKLSSPLPILELPSDHPRPAVQTFQGAVTTFQLDSELSKKLVKLSQQEGVTLFMTLLAAFKVMLHRYVNQADLCVGTTIANRHTQALESLIGFFINTIVLRTDLGGNPSFTELLQQVRQVTWEAYEHQDLPFHLLVEKLQPERDLSHSPLFQVMFVLENAPLEVLDIPGATIKPLNIPVATAKFDLTLSMRETASGLFGKFEYNQDLFTAETINRMVGHLQTLLSAIVDNPQQHLSELPLLTKAEQQQLLVEWNDTAVSYPDKAVLHELFTSQAEKTPDAVAVAWEEQQLTYQELNQRANQLAHHLQNLGVKPEVLVGLCVERSPLMIIGLLGILKAGGAYVPLDPTYPQERLAFMLSDAQVPVLLTQESVVSKLPDTQAQIIVLDDWSKIGAESKQNPINEATPDNLAYVIYTSGSTGVPKGTMIPHRGVVNYLSWCTQEYKVAENSGAPINSSIAFDATITSIFSPLLVGRRVLLLPEVGEIEALSRSLQTREQERGEDFSLVKITPAHLEMLNSLVNWENRSQTRALILGGEALLAKTLEYWRSYAPHTRLINEYGPTETVVGCCIYEVSPQTPHTGSVPIGRPIANTQIYLLDPYLQPVPIGVPGEMYIGGAGVARGYLNRPDLTTERFIPNPWQDNQSSSQWLYKTGDLARYQADGTIEYLGRIDNQVKIRGFRIELGEVEAVLAQHPEVKETVIVVREDIPGDKRLVAYFVAEQEQSLTTSELQSFLKAKLPNYMVPSAFVELTTLPLTSNGKVDRGNLPAPEARPKLEADYVPPQNEVEEIVAQVWQELLQLEKVGVNDNFFDLGGHSLLLVRMQVQLQEIFERKIAVVDLFKYPTIKTLTQYLSTKETNSPHAQPTGRATNRLNRQASRQQKRRSRQERRRR